MTKKNEFVPLIAPEIANYSETKTQIGKFHTKGGKGYAAEDANAMADKLKGKTVKITGKSNELNGPDRISDGVKIQTKYFETASKTIYDSFGKNGFYKYEGQCLEVPNDQYDSCVKIMRKKISEGKVPGFSNPDEAELIVKKGDLTYNQARNIARAGNIDSILYDAKNGAVVSSYLFAISFAYTYARNKWDGKNNSDAIEDAIKCGIATGTTSFITGIVVSQVLRTRAAAVGTVIARSGIKTIAGTAAGRTAIQSIASASLGKTIYGAAAVNHVSKLLRSNVITSVVVTAVTTTPDFYRAAISGSISWKQFTKNLVVNAASVAGGVGGWMGGAAAGAAVGSVVPGVGTAIGGVIGGICGAFAGGSAAGHAVKAISDEFCDDDAKIMLKSLQKAMELISYEFLLLENEVNELIEEAENRVKNGFLLDMYEKSAGNQEKAAKYAKEELEPFVFELIQGRKKISLPKVEKVMEIVNETAKLVEESSLQKISSVN